MTRIAMVELDQPGTGGLARVYLKRDLLEQYPLTELQRMLNELFVEDEDRDRLARIEVLLRTAASLRVSIYPGETSPPEYHVFIHDPASPGAPLFAFVLAPVAVISEMLADPPHLVFETATFQAVNNDTSPQALRSAVESWAARMWPGLKLPLLELRPWPIEEVHTRLPSSPVAPPQFVPRNAPVLLDASDYPLPEELSA